jgi:hypothetical protein
MDLLEKSTIKAGEGEGERKEAQQQQEEKETQQGQGLTRPPLANGGSR